MGQYGFFYDFIESLSAKDNKLKDLLTDFLIFLGFDDSYTDELNVGERSIMTLVNISDDRRILLSVIVERDYIKGRYTIVDKCDKILDIIDFRKEGEEWIEIGEDE